MIKNLNDLKINKVESLDELKKLVVWFCDKKINFHPEDDFNDYIDYKTGKKTFYKKDANKLNKLFEQGFANLNHNKVWSIVLTDFKKMLSS